MPRGEFTDFLVQPSFETMVFFFLTYWGIKKSKNSVVFIVVSDIEASISDWV